MKTRMRMKKRMRMRISTLSIKYVEIIDHKMNTTKGVSENKTYD